jgi:hypothetical protein
MLPNFVIEETTAREAGESPVFAIDCSDPVILTLGITHSMEHQSLDLDVFLSEDGIHWPQKPAASFNRKFYCGSYQLLLPPGSVGFLRASWRVSRWSRDEGKPLFRFYLFAESARARVAGAA